MTYKYFTDEELDGNLNVDQIKNAIQRQVDAVRNAIEDGITGIAEDNMEPPEMLAQFIRDNFFEHEDIADSSDLFGKDIDLDEVKMMRQEACEDLLMELDVF